MTGITTEPSGLPHRRTLAGRGLGQGDDVRVEWGIRIRSARLRQQAAPTADVHARASDSQAS
jgi:hypothetical protein